MLFRKDLEQGNEHCIKKLTMHLSEMREGDFILPIGDPIMIGLATHIALHFGEGSVNILRWVREAYRYTPEHITV